MDEETTTRIIASFRDRAEKLQTASLCILIIILISLAAGTYLFVFSGNIAIRDVTSLKAVRPNKTLLPQIGFEGTNTTGMVFDNYNERIKRLEAEISNKRNYQQNNEQNQIYLISTVTTKIGSVMILLFLVQILVTLYRYNTRLSAYYDARADALELVSGQSIADLEQIIKALSPEGIDFGKTPSSPAEQAVELAKEILSRDRSKEL